MEIAGDALKTGAALAVVAAAEPSDRAAMAAMARALMFIFLFLLSDAVCVGFG